METPNIGEFLKQKRKEAGLTAEEAAQALKDKGIDVAAKTISGYENGRSHPRAETFVALCFVYGCTNPIPYFSETKIQEDVLSKEERGLVDNYRKLSNYNQRTVNILVNRLVEGCKSFISTIQKPIYELPASAGKGQFLDSDDFELMNFPEESVPKDTTFAVRVSGDSMEPNYKDGDIVFVKRTKELYLGDVGIFVLDNESFIKEVGANNSLISYNPAYNPIIVQEYDDLRIVGKVIGKYEK